MRVFPSSHLSLCAATSYGGDSEDSDWAPSVGGGGGGEGEPGSLEEDVGELVGEADSFLKNRKMWRT